MLASIITRTTPRVRSRVSVSSSSSTTSTAASTTASSTTTLRQVRRRAPRRHHVEQHVELRSLHRPSDSPQRRPDDRARFGYDGRRTDRDRDHLRDAEDRRPHSQQRLGAHVVREQPGDDFASGTAVTGNATLLSQFEALYTSTPTTQQTTDLTAAYNALAAAVTSSNITSANITTINTDYAAVLAAEGSTSTATYPYFSLVTGRAGPGGSEAGATERCSLLGQPGPAASLPPGPATSQ